MRLRTQAALMLALSALVPLVPATAHAAVPTNRPADIVISCGDGTRDKAKMWTYDGTTSGVRNRCARKWMVIIFWQEEGGSTTVSVAPRTEARWTGGPATHSHGPHGPQVAVDRKPATCAPFGSWLQLQGSHGGPQRKVQCGERIRGTHVKHWR